MASVRPILERIRTTPWVANEPVGEGVVKDFLPKQIQIAVRGDGPLSQRDLVPLTPAAHELLYGTHRDGAHTMIRGLLGTLDARSGTANLRGLSFADSDAGFAVNMLASNIEAGAVANTIEQGDRTAFQSDFTSIALGSLFGGAQNLGWMDFGPEASKAALDVARRGADAATESAQLFARTGVHELQHSDTAPTIDVIGGELEWLEEGVAEALTWWPGVIPGAMRRVGASAERSELPLTPFTQGVASASDDYQSWHQAVLELLELAGITHDAKDPATAALTLQRATTLLQGVSLDQVPRQLARAIARHNGLDASEVPALADLIRHSMGDADEIAALRELISGTRARPAG